MTTNNQTVGNKKSINDVPVEDLVEEGKTSPKKPKKMTDHSVPKEQGDKIKKLADNDVLIGPSSEQANSRNRNNDASLKVADGKTKSRILTKAARYAVKDYIPLGASHR